MANMNDREQVTEQYKDDQALAARIRLHAKYSTNPQGLTEWLFNQYAFKKGDRVLELGCGNAAQWEGRLGDLPENVNLTLTDMSPGMIHAASMKLGPASLHHRYGVVDIQDIPFDNGSFDIAIANFMLYHVPDLDRALSQVKRVLKPGGILYAATNGNGGLHAFMRDVVLSVDPAAAAFEQSFPFSLQNGGSILACYFYRVQRVDYIDSLRVTNTEDLMDWLLSTIYISGLSPSGIDAMRSRFDTMMRVNGFILIPKEAGMFIAS